MHIVVFALVMGKLTHRQHWRPNSIIQGACSSNLILLATALRCACVVPIHLSDEVHHHVRPADLQLAL